VLLGYEKDNKYNK